MRFVFWAVFLLVLGRCKSTVNGLSWTHLSSITPTSPSGPVCSQGTRHRGRRFLLRSLLDSYGGSWRSSWNRSVKMLTVLPVDVANYIYKKKPPLDFSLQGIEIADRVTSLCLSCHAFVCLRFLQLCLGGTLSASTSLPSTPFTIVSRPVRSGAF